MSGLHLLCKSVRVASDFWPSGFLRIVVLRGGEERWEDAYDTCLIIRPNRRQRRDGTWVETKLIRQHRSVQVISNIFGRWYYLGSYQCVEVLDLDLHAFTSQPEKVILFVHRVIWVLTLDLQTQRGILRFMAHGDARTEAREMILRGDATVKTTQLRRVEFNEDVQSALVAAGARQLGDVDSDGSYRSDDETYS